MTPWRCRARAPVRVRRLTDQEGQKLQQIVRRGSTSSVRYRRAMMLLASAGGKRKRPDRLPATYHRTHGVRYFHGCYSVGDDTLWGVNRRRKGAGNTLAALKSICAARPDGAPIYVILDDVSAHKGADIRRWAKKHKVELCFTPTYASWANPIEAHFGPLRQFTITNSNHPNHTVQTKALHAYLRWRNANARHRDVLAAEHKERARIRSEKGIRWGGRLISAAA
ncbi:transposase [Streptomyces griseoluteus]|uniref:transposase n=1 Tax=Streptomyces griseoluteus TaxID=29306 RepID=UPI0036FB8288